MSPALSGSAPAGADSPAPRNTRTASGAIMACGAASATPAMRLGAASIGAMRPTSAPRRSNTGPPPALVSTRSDNDRPRRVARERSGACRHPRSGETEDDQIRRQRAEAGSFALRIEISGDHRQARRGVRALEPDGLAADGRVRAVVRLERRQRLAGRDDERGRGRLGVGRGRNWARPGGLEAAPRLRPASWRAPRRAGERLKRIGDCDRDPVELGGLRWRDR